MQYLPCELHSHILSFLAPKDFYNFKSISNNTSDEVGYWQFFGSVELARKAIKYNCISLFRLATSDIKLSTETLQRILYLACKKCNEDLSYISYSLLSIKATHVNIINTLLINSCQLSVIHRLVFSGKWITYPNDYVNLIKSKMINTLDIIRKLDTNQNHGIQYLIENLCYVIEHNKIDIFKFILPSLMNMDHIYILDLLVMYKRWNMLAVIFTKYPRKFNEWLFDDYDVVNPETIDVVKYTSYYLTADQVLYLKNIIQKYHDWLWKNASDDKIYIILAILKLQWFSFEPRKYISHVVQNGSAMLFKLLIANGLDITLTDIKQYRNCNPNIMNEMFYVLYSDRLNNLVLSLILIIIFILVSAIVIKIENTNHKKYPCQIIG